MALSRLFRLLETTRGMPQYGYALAEIPRHELSDLAQHHYLVTIIALQMAKHLVNKGAVLNVQKVMELCLIHDLGELFGGDIALPYALANPEARKAAKTFEAENNRYLSTWFEDAEGYQSYAQEAASPQSPEAIVAKIADYVEVLHYKLYVRRLSTADISMMEASMQKIALPLQGSLVHDLLLKFIREWCEELGAMDKQELFENSKSAQ